MARQFPDANRKVSQTNRSKVFGNLWSTFNMDFLTSLGFIRVSPRVKLNTNGLDGCPVAFKWFDTKIWAICGTKLYGNGGLPSSQSFTEDASSGFQTDYSADESDMELFNATLCSTTTDALYSKASNGSGTGANTARDVLGTGGQHVLCYFKKYDRLYYSNASDNVISIDTSWVTADPGASYAISLCADSEAYKITSMKPTSRWIWIGIMDKSDESGRGKVLQWDGLSSTIDEKYNLNGQGCMAIVIDPINDVPYAMDTYGVLSKFTGSGFEEVGRLPISEKLLADFNDVDNERFIHPNGLTFTKNGTIRANVNNKNADGTYNENFHSGVYEFDLKGSCIHVASLGYTSDTTITDFGQSRVSRIGALAQMDIYSNSASRNGTFLAGATYFTDATSTSNGIFFDDSNDVLQKYGYLITTFMMAKGVTDMWQKALIRFKKFLSETDKFILKYRITEAEPVEFTLTWVSTTSFTTTTNLSTYVDYEVEVLNGTGAGQCSHITSVTGSGTYTVVVDETYTGVTSGTAKARCQNWKRLGSYSLQTVQYAEFSMNTTGVWLQMKLCMKFTGKNEIYDMTISEQSDQEV